MPRVRSKKAIVIEATIIVGFMALAGHIGVNFWERYIIQSELSQMKTSLHFLKSNLINIGTAYDKLHQEIKGLAEVTEKKHSLINNLQIAPEKRMYKNKYTLDRRKLHDVQVGAVIEAKNAAHNFPSKANKTTGKNSVKLETRNVGVTPTLEKIIKNITTMTRYPPKSTAAGASYKDENEYCRHDNVICNRYKCYDHHSYCCNDPFTYWNM